MRILGYRIHSSRFGAAFLIVTSVAAFAGARPAWCGTVWSTVVNNNDLIPPLEERNFNSYNQPSINVDGLVVIRARSRGGSSLGPATHGIYTRDMSVAGSPIVRILDRTTLVPAPNNLGTLFVETPSFPRIDISSDTIATRGNHQPAWEVIDPISGETLTRAGTSGIYTNPFGPLITGAQKLGAVAGFEFFAVPEIAIPRSFDVFPGSPSITDGATLVFKGNAPGGKTGIYYRDLVDEPIDGNAGGGTEPLVMIANNTDTVIPGTSVVFGSTAPPSAAGRRAVFAGFDNEENPTQGGIYLASLAPSPPLRTLVAVGATGTTVVDELGVPLPGKPRFRTVGEGLSFDGRFVGFWGAWGADFREVTLSCTDEGNKCRVAYCNAFADDTVVDVPVNQGIFVFDTKARTKPLRMLARAGSAGLEDFVFWSYSGAPPVEWCEEQGIPAGGEGEGDSDDGEPPRWRSSAFVSAYTLDNQSAARVAFKAKKSNGRVGIYLRTSPGLSRMITLLDTSMDGQKLDPEAPPGSIITELGLEREGLRGNWLAISAKMNLPEADVAEEEESDMAGIYVRQVPKF